tara:strand:+ start:556 stop:825 length:270 start_codon:yes stop_codon:yes gene_type:complete
MEQLNLTVELSSKSRVIASSGAFQIELMKQVGLEDHPQLIEISHHLASEYGDAAVLTKEPSTNILTNVIHSHSLLDIAVILLDTLLECL